MAINQLPADGSQGIEENSTNEPKKKKKKVDCLTDTPSLAAALNDSIACGETISFHVSLNSQFSRGTVRPSKAGNPNAQ